MFTYSIIQMSLKQISIKLTDNQKKKILREFKKYKNGELVSNHQIKLLINKKNMEGPDKIQVGIRQYNRYNKNKKNNMGMSLSLPVKQVEVYGEGLFGDIFKTVKKVGRKFDETLWDGYDVATDIFDKGTKVLPAKFRIPVKLTQKVGDELIAKPNRKMNELSWDTIDKIKF